MAKGASKWSIENQGIFILVYSVVGAFCPNC